MKLVIAKYRKKKGWTQAELAKEAGLTRSMIAQYETGGSGVPFTTILTKIADALEVEVGELFEEEHNGDIALPKGRPPKEDPTPLEEEPAAQEAAHA